MSALFRKNFIELFNQSYTDHSIEWQDEQWAILQANLRSASFNVFTQKPFKGPQPVIDYLGRYSHRVAISNHRIIDVTKDRVSFKYRDYRDDQEKILRLTPREFTRRFLQHILPKGFAKIRHYGILANKAKSIYIPDILFFFERRRPSKSKFNQVTHLLKKFDVNILMCPVCEKGSLQRSTELPPARGDPTFKVNLTRLIQNRSIYSIQF